jgi:hypothetical protein
MWLSCDELVDMDEIVVCSGMAIEEEKVAAFFRSGSAEKSEMELGKEVARRGGETWWMLGLDS